MASLAKYRCSRAKVDAGNFVMHCFLLVQITKRVQSFNEYPVHDVSKLT
jgi:hypothetical protein